MKNLSLTELILNPDGSIYHLNLMPGETADYIILAGDPGRIEMISSFFDNVEIKRKNREFITHTGMYKGERISAVSTGIGVGNIDIVINELDALANIDFTDRKKNKNPKKLNFIRIGTAGSLQKDIPPDSFVLSEVAVGLDGMLNFYAGIDNISDSGFEKAFSGFMQLDSRLGAPYVVYSSGRLFDILKGKQMIPGATISAPGFYGPQGRELRLAALDSGLNSKIERFRFGKYRICNYEMECSAIYGLSKLLCHDAITVCAIIANRITGAMSVSHGAKMEELIDIVLRRLVDNDNEKKRYTGTDSFA
jgi:uridine phosphorylase